MLTQSQGAFSDNAFKTLVVFLIVGSEANRGERDLVLLVGALFAIPFILFSMSGGFLADRFSKRNIVIATKVMELAVMSLGMAGLALDDLYLKVAAVFLMSVQSALFTPSKYGLLPELLPEKRLSWANGMVQMFTLMAVILGTVAGGIMAESLRDRQWLSGFAFLGLAVVGGLSALGIRKVPSADPLRRFRYNIFGDLMDHLVVIRRDRTLSLAVLGVVFFYFLGPLLQFNILFFGVEVLQVGETANSLLSAAVAVGIGLGSVASGYLARGKIEYGFVPLGALGMTFFGGLMALPGVDYAQAAALLGCTGLAAGFYIVPVHALIQHLPDDDHRGGVIASSNLLSFIGVLLASAIYYLLSDTMGLSTRQIFLASSIIALVATAYMIRLLPVSLLRLVLWLLANSVYRVQVSGRDNIPEKGGALFVCNHLSFVDGLLLIASTDRQIRFIMFKDYYDHPLIRPFVRVLRAIPIASDLPPREMLRSLQAATDAIAQGDVVCIFAEGQITRLGHLLPFRRGMERIMKGLDEPVVPVHLDGVWGSLFSFERGRFFWKLPRRLGQRVQVRYGRPLPADSPPFRVRRAVQELEGLAWRERLPQSAPLQRGLIASARRHARRLAFADQQGTLSFMAGLSRAWLLARRLRPHWRDEKRVGVLLPPSIEAALANWAAFLAGKEVVNLDSESGAISIEEQVRLCAIETVLSSAQDLEGLGASVGCRCLRIEELSSPGLLGRLAARFMCRAAPRSWLERLAGARRPIGIEDVAAVVFSSGRSGRPKGVLLSHGNLVSNVEQLGRVFFLDRNDRILGVQPFQQAFGLTSSLLLPGVLGLGTVFLARASDARTAGILAKRHQATLLPASPRFLEACLKGVDPGHFGSLDFVLSGGEPLSDEIAGAFQERFGLRPLEGYGLTECSPVVSVSTRDYREAGIRQVGAKQGRIGHPLPGIDVRVIDPDQGGDVRPGRSGVLQVKGPNVMKGYLDSPQSTAQVLHEGWLTTGDLASIDDDGFLRLEGRFEPDAPQPSPDAGR